MTTARRILAVAIVIGMTFSGMKAEPTRAQSTGFLTEDVADVVAASTVMLSALLLKTENGLEDREPYMECYLGSGSVISDDARFILTNSHVLDLVIVAEDLAASETKNLIDETPGRNVSIRVAELSVWVVDDIEMNPADRRYRAEILEGEQFLALRQLDLALLEIVGHSQGRDRSRRLLRPHLELGDSAGVRAITLSGYPAPANSPTDDPECASVPKDSVLQVPGSRIGIAEDDSLLVQAGAWQGMSGGAAVDDEGRLIGIPARVRDLETGSGPVEVIPIENARELVQEVIALDSPVAEATSTPPPVPPTPTPSPELATATPTLTPTSTPVPPTSTPATATPLDVSALLPEGLPLAHASCLEHVEGSPGSRQLQEVAQLLGADGASALQAWGWQDNAWSILGCDPEDLPPGTAAGAVGYLDIDVNRFADAGTARAAIDAFALARAGNNGLLEFVAPPPVGDYQVALAGPASNGQDFSLYAHRGSLFVRVIGVSPSGAPEADVETVVRTILDAEGPAELRQQSPSPPSESSAATYLPALPDVAHASCFTVAAQGPFTYDDVVDALQQTGMAMAEIDAVGWEEGAYVVFTCPEPPAGRAGQIDIVVHRFGNVEAAAYVLPFLANTFVPGENESRSCDASGALVVCVTGVAASGSPLSDVAFVMQQVLGAAR